MLQFQLLNGNGDHEHYNSLLCSAIFVDKLTLNLIKKLAIKKDPGKEALLDAAGTSKKMKPLLNVFSEWKLNEILLNFKHNNNGRKRCVR